MEKVRIQKFLSAQSEMHYLYAIRLNDLSNVVGQFDKKEMIENTTNIWKFYLNDDFANRKIKTKQIQINGDDIFTLDAFG